MTHVDPDDLVLFFYGEHEQPSAIEGHLEVCDRCREELARLKRSLAHVDEWDRSTLPDPGPSFGPEMWARVAPALGHAAPRRPSRHPSIPWGALTAVAAALLVAFFTGLFVGRVGDADAERADAVRPGETHGPIVLIAVGDHLESAQRLLIELVNVGDPDDEWDADRHRARAAELASFNRVYRRGAVAAGELMVADVLDELERTLLEIAHAPAGAAREDLEDLRRRIERRGILMKIRVLEETRRPSPAGAA